MEQDPGDGELQGFVQRHHVHFTVEPEWAFAGNLRWPVGFEVRLFAVLPRGVAALPGSPSSRALAASLRALAERVLPDCGYVARFQIEPFRPALYESREMPGADEVALTIRLLHPSRYPDPVDTAEERCLKGVRDRLKGLALVER